jgi:hypothetical protein
MARSPASERSELEPHGVQVFDGFERPDPIQVERYYPPTIDRSWQRLDDADDLQLVELSQTVAHDLVGGVAIVRSAVDPELSARAYADTRGAADPAVGVR